MTDQRIGEVDATRGVAMLFVCLSHFAMAYFERNGAQQFAFWSYIISQVASPTFMLVSGMMLGLLYAKHAADFRTVRRAFILRGLYLLTVVHAALLVPHMWFEGSVGGGLRWMFMTDTIGLNLIIGALLIDKVPVKIRILGVILLYTVSTAIAFFWRPEGYSELALKDVLVGENYSSGFFREFFAIVPWFSFYFGASVVGERLAQCRVKENGEAEFTRWLWKTSAILGSVVALVFLTKPALRTFAFDYLNLDLTGILSSTTKRPPSPAYFVAHCAIGMAILAGFYTWGRSNPFNRLMTAVASLQGRSSLFTYVLHYYVYFVLLLPFSATFSPFWPFLFVGSLFLLTAAAYFWDRKKLYQKVVRPSISMPARGKVSPGKALAT